MIQEEKDKLISLFDDEARWCRGVDAADARGQAVHYDDKNAVSWDIVGGLCHLFGWKRACRLFEPISRHLTGERHLAAPLENQEIAAMSALLDFNDDDGTTYETMMTRLRELPVWHGTRASF
jgi:hypothetical protein